MTKKDNRRFNSANASNGIGENGIPEAENAIADMAKHKADTTALTITLREETLTWIFTIVSSILVCSGLALLISRIYHPDIASLKAIGYQLLITSSAVRPEPVEGLLAKLAAVMMPLLLFGFYHLFSKSKWTASLANKKAFTPLSILFVSLIIALGYFAFSALNPFGDGNGDLTQTKRDFRASSNFDFYFGDLFLGNHLLLYSFFIVPLIGCLFFIGIRKYQWDEKKIRGVNASYISYGIVAAVILCCIGMCTFSFPAQWENQYDFGAVYYSMTQVYAGSPMLANGFTNTYGLYPHFLNPLFQIIGLSVFKFSLVMSLLMGAGFAINFYCLRQFTRNRLIQCLGMLTVIFFTFLDFKVTERFDANFALYSIRLIIPSTLLLLATLYLKKQSNKLYWTGTAIMAFFVLWNPEFGIISFVGWLLFHSFIDTYNTGKAGLKKALMRWVQGAAVLLAAIYCFKLVIYLTYGAAPDMSLLSSAIIIFSKLGFNMLPMALLHPWNLMVLILIAGFVYAISERYKQQLTPKSAIVFLISFLGMGTFFYFQGRSHNWNFAMSCGMGLLLLTILGDELWTLIKVRGVIALNVLFILFLYVISFSVFEIVANAGKIYELQWQTEDQIVAHEESQLITQVKNFVVNTTNRHDKIHMFTLRKFQALMFDGDQRASAFNPGMIDLFLKSDLTRLEDELRDSSFKVIITPYTFQNLNFMSRAFAAMAATYEFSSGNGNIMSADKRKMKNPPQTFFGNMPGTLVHRKYNDDIASADRRIDDAAGVKPVSLNQDFSVEVLFDATQQVFPLATLVGNGDSSGFMISTNLSNGYFVINGTSYMLPFPENMWVYCVMNVFRDRFEIYENGFLIGKDNLPRSIINTPNKLCIGNYGYMHYYTGAIAEVAVTNATLDSNQIKKTWSEIEKALPKQ
jgi:hypothetical protein